MLTKTETRHLAEVVTPQILTAPPRNFIWLIPVALGLLIAAPVILIVVTRYPTVDILSELTIYRIGNAASLLFGERKYVLPVQGLPIALLAKAELWAISLVRPTLALSPFMLAAYQTVYFGVLFVASIVAIALTWHTVTNVQRGALLLLFACPWVLGGAPISLLIEPDYWIGEWSYLVVSLCLLLHLDSRPYSARALIWIGAWLAIGVGMKITMLGIAPLFLLAANVRSSKAFTAIVAVLVATYFLMALLYMGTLPSAAHLIASQVAFFVRPNASIQWANLLPVLMDRPFLLCLLAAWPLVLLLSGANLYSRIAALLWSAGLVYLVWKRPHDTSIATAATVVTFLVCYFIRSAAALALVLTLLITGAALQGFERVRWEQTVLRTGWGQNELNIPPIHGMLFIPDNYWNAGLAVQALGFNGMMGFYYRIGNNPDGSPKYEEGGKAFDALSPGVVMIPDSTYALDIAERGLKTGTPLWWTRRDPIPPGSTQGSLERLSAMVARSGATIETFPFKTNGEDWLLQKAHRIPK